MFEHVNMWLSHVLFFQKKTSASPTTHDVRVFIRMSTMLTFYEKVNTF